MTLSRQQTKQNKTKTAKSQKTKTKAIERKTEFNHQKGQLKLVFSPLVKNYMDLNTDLQTCYTVPDPD